MQWYYVEDGKRMGPVEEPEFRALVSSGKIIPKTLVWCAGMAEWVAYESIPRSAEAGAKDEASAQPEATPVAQDENGVCRECGKTFPLQDMITYEGATICAECKPKFFQRVQEGAAIPGQLIYAGFWIRFCAKFVDGLILCVVNWTLMGIMFGTAFFSAASGHAKPMLGMWVLFYAIEISFSVAYSVFFVGKFGATPGKMACKLKIIRSDGSRVSYGKAVGRFFAEWISGIILYIGYIMVVFDEEKRALHDRICDTRVIRL